MDTNDFYTPRWILNDNLSKTEAYLGDDLIASYSNSDLIEVLSFWQNPYGNPTSLGTVSTENEAKEKCIAEVAAFFQDLINKQFAAARNNKIIKAGGIEEYLNEIINGE